VKIFVDVKLEFERGVCVCVMSGVLKLGVIVYDVDPVIFRDHEKQMEVPKVTIELGCLEEWAVRLGGWSMSAQFMFECVELIFSTTFFLIFFKTLIIYFYFLFSFFSFL